MFISLFDHKRDLYTVHFKDGKTKIMSGKDLRKKGWM